MLKAGWSQKQEGKLLRVCSECKRYFHCTGACGSSIRLKFVSYCACPECADDNILWYRKEECPAYKDLDIDEIFYRCYGFRREER